MYSSIDSAFKSPCPAVHSDEAGLDMTFMPATGQWSVVKCP